jgi:hypothetical protein
MKLKSLITRWITQEKMHIHSFHGVQGVQNPAKKIQNGSKVSLRKPTTNVQVEYVCPLSASNWIYSALVGRIACKETTPLKPDPSPLMDSILFLDQIHC